MSERFNRRHLIMMSLGNIIGSGIFLGSSSVISAAGPAAVLSYAVGGLIMALEVMFITEMSVINPAPGSFRVHASEIFGPWIGFVNGWMFWCSGVLGMASEVAAAAIFTRYWLPKIPLWIFCIIYTVIMMFVNFNNLRNLSRIESILASVKILALIVFLGIGVLILLKILPANAADQSRPFSSIQNFLPNGFSGVFASMIMVMFSYTGTGIIGLAIADTEKPEKNAPFAIRTIILSVVSLFVLSTFFIVKLTSWNSLSSEASPFVVILNRLRIPFADSLLNFVVLTAALSGLNSSLYSSSRMINSLSRDKQAPSIFLKTNKNGVPVYALGLSGAALLITAVLSYWIPEKLFVLLAAASGFLALFNWLTIAVTHYFYRKKTLKENPEKLKYKAPGYPFANFIELILIVAVLASAVYGGQSVSLIIGVLLFLFLTGLYFLLKKLKKI